MTIDLFDPALAAKRRASNRGSGDVVGRFRSGYQVSGNPASLSTWRVTTGDPEVAERLHELLGGDEPQEWDTAGEDNIELFTDAADVNIILPNRKAIDPQMLIWTRGQKRLLVCDGSIYEPEDKRPYQCTLGGFTSKAEHEEQGHLCEPRISITFKLADAPELGLFRFESGAWSLATEIAGPIGDVGDREDVLANLSLEEVESRTRTFTKPVLEVSRK